MTGKHPPEQKHHNKGAESTMYHPKPDIKIYNALNLLHSFRVIFFT
jgi:hypothetical protein